MQIEKDFDATVQVLCNRDLQSIIYKYLGATDIMSLHAVSHDFPLSLNFNQFIDKFKSERLQKQTGKLHEKRNK